MNMYFEEKMYAAPQPCMFFCERPFAGGKEKKKPNRLECSLVSLGSSKSVCECLSIQAGMAILHKIGLRNLEVQINSVGDKESMNDFTRKMTLFIKKNYNAFPPDLRQALKKDIFVLVKEPKEEWKSWATECPKALDHLSEVSRLHFKEVLEFLEIMEIPYSINPHLMSDPDIGSETVYSIQNEEGELASGFRYNKLGRKIGCKREIPSAILNISAKLKKNLKKVKIKKAKPQFYLVQFGGEAKLRSYLILQELYRAGASVSHSIAKDKLSSQIGVAETSEAEYIILVGQKEALENSVVIRHNITRAQEIVSIPNLGVKVKGLA